MIRLNIWISVAVLCCVCLATQGSAKSLQDQNDEIKKEDSNSVVREKRAEYEGQQQGHQRRGSTYAPSPPPDYLKNMSTKMWDWFTYVWKGTTGKWWEPSTDDWRYRTSDDWRYRSTDDWRYRTSDDWRYRTTDDWRYRTSDNWRYRSTDNWQYRSTDNWRPSTQGYGCFNLYCMNGGYCTDWCLGEDYCCKCPPRFTGRYCEREIKYCYSNPCLNGGTCVESGMPYTCQCADGYTGRYCEKAKPATPGPKPSNFNLDVQKIQLVNIEQYSINGNGEVVGRNSTTTAFGKIWDFLSKIKDYLSNITRK